MKHDLISHIVLFILLSLAGLMIMVFDPNSATFAASEDAAHAPEETVSRVCGHCHALKVADQCLAGDCINQRTLTTQGRDWERLTEWMKFFNCEMPGQDQKTVAEFLKTRYPGSPLPISWTHVETVPVGWNIVTMVSAGSYLYAGVEGGGRIYRSPDGQHWREVLNTGQGTVYGITQFNGKLFAGTDVTRPELWSSADGADWSRVFQFPAEEDGITALGTFKGRLYAGTRQTGIYRSSDGLQWERMTRLEEDRRTYFRFLTEYKDHLYAGYEPGGRIFRSPDGRTWTEVGGDLPSPVGVRGIAVFNGALFVGTNSPVQIWKTENGTRWEKVFDPTPDIKQGYVGSLAVFQDHLYAGVNAHTPRPVDVYRTGDGIHWEEGGEITPFTIEAMAPFGDDLYLGAVMPPRAWIYRTSGLKPSLRAYAVEDIPVRGKVTGTYRDTQTGYDQYEMIEEAPGPSGPGLEHKWRFKLPPAARSNLTVQAFRSDSGEDLGFAYSTDDKEYHDLFRLTKTEDDQTYQLFPLPVLNGGPLYIRVKGEFEKGKGPDRAKKPRALYLDHLYVLSEGPAAPRPAEPKTPI